MRVVGVDTGGTFTDLVLVDGNEIRIHKLPSTPDDPARAVLDGLDELLGSDTFADAGIIHGSTVATNALLERKGASIALVTTAGFEDVIEIGRQARREIYDLAVAKPEPLVPEERRFGISERLDERGDVVVPLDPADLPGLVENVLSTGARSIAICLLHSYASPGHERAIAEAFASAGASSGEQDGGTVFISASCDILPEFREYERTSTTAVNAYVGPVMSRYLGRIGERLGPDRVRIMASNGGVVSLDAAGRLAVQTILSGPAGGAVGGFEIGRLAGYDRVITFDMGGTSTDVSLCAGELTRTSEAEIGGLPIRVPVIDIHTVGAGGGSIACRDPGGSLRVGPESAGADPGPVCYGLGGDRLTVTDANLFLGRLSPQHFLGGDRELEPGDVEPAVARLATQLGLDPVAVAEGVIRVANATMERAIRVISLERGFDPREFTLVCFGGAGGLHAVDLARALGIPRVLVPARAGVLSALGMLLADPVRDFSRTVMRPLDGLAAASMEADLADLETRARHELAGEGIAAGRLRFERIADLRYAGQGFELSVPLPERVGDDDDLAALFHERHDRRYGYADPGRSVEVVTLRVRVIAAADTPTLPERRPEGEDASGAILGEQAVTCGGETLAAKLIDRERLRPGNCFEGPAVVVEYSTTTFVPPDASARVDVRENLILTPGA